MSVVSKNSPHLFNGAEIPGVSEKKYGIADYLHFKNGINNLINTQQYNIFRHYKYNFYL